VVGTTHKKTRDVLQEMVCGPITEIGSGMIRKSFIDRKPNKDFNILRKTGTSDAIDKIFIKGKYGKSQIQFKSYEEGLLAFESDDPDIVWLDEECPQNIYSSCLTRTMTKNGVVLVTFTPLKGYTQLILDLEKTAEESPDVVKITRMTWDDAPHLTDEQKKDLWASIPPHEREARSKGVPSLGSGAIYPVADSEITCDPFKIPTDWPRAYGMDVGWNWTAAVWGALDRDNDILYIYAEYKQGQKEPAMHAQNVKTNGEWIPGWCDWAGTNQSDGQRIIHIYQQLGLNLMPAIKSVNAGITRVFDDLTTNKIKIFTSCQQLLEEKRMYRRDEKGKIVKENDHLMDAFRYLRMAPVNAFLHKAPGVESIDIQTNGFGW